MKILILVHSATGHTLFVANELKMALQTKKHVVDLTPIVASDEKTQNESLISLSPLPSCAPYDLVLIGAPVRAFSATPAIKKALKQLEGLHGKNCILFTTEQLPLNFMGGNQAIKKMKNALLEKGALVIDSSIIHWNSPNKADAINAFINAVVQGYAYE